MSAKASRTARVALIATLAIQIVTSLAATAPAVLAPVLAADLGITPKWIGVFVGLVYAGAMLSSLACGGFIARFGAIRVSQVCVLLCAAGTATVALLPVTAVGLLVVAAFVIGVGYGPITPASSAVLVHTTPPTQMALTFSIKQTGVPAGMALGGALLPALALGLGWRGALLAVAALGALVALAAQPIRRTLDAHRERARPVSLRGVVEPLRLVLATRSLRELSLVGLAFAAVQVCLTSFLVSFLHEGNQLFVESQCQAFHLVGVNLVDLETAGELQDAVPLNVRQFPGARTVGARGPSDFARRGTGLTVNPGPGAQRCRNADAAAKARRPRAALRAVAAAGQAWHKMSRPRSR